MVETKTNYKLNQFEQDCDSFYQILKGEVLPLSNEYYHKARKQCQQHPKSQKWRIYLYVLALEAFKQWLEEKDLQCLKEKGLTVDDKECKILQPWYLNLVDTGCILQVKTQVGDLKICLIVNEDLSDEQVIIPRALIENSQQNPAHFYVLIEMWESEKSASIRGFFSHLQLLKKISEKTGKSEKAGKFIQDEYSEDYEITLKYFNLDSDKLLRYLESPNVIPAPLFEAVAQTESNSLNWQEKSQAIIERIKANIRSLLSQGVSLKDQLAQVLNWEDKLFLINHPQLIKPYVQNVINLALWFNYQIDNIASESGWSFPRTPQLAGGGGVNDFQPVIRELKQVGQKIYCSTRKEKIGYLPLEIMMGLLPQQDSVDLKEPDFLLILRHERGAFLPEGLKLEVWNKNKTNCFSRLTLQKKELFLVHYVKTLPDEEFTITITFNNEVVDLDSFIFAF